MRALKIFPPVPDDISDPHLVVGVTGSGPFLLRDADFRGKMVDLPRELPETTVSPSIEVTSPIHPKLISAEMEAHGFMDACHQREVPASVLKGISDLGDLGKAALEDQSGGFFRAYACSNAVLALLHMLRLCPRPPRQQDERSRGRLPEPPVDPQNLNPTRANEHLRVVEVFVGRTDDMAAVRKLLATHSRVAILGAPGVGKTTMAWQLAAERPRSLFVPLTPAYDVPDVIRSVAIRLNIPLLEESWAAEQITEALANRGIELLVLDGFEHAPSARSLITRWSQSTTVLVTTQVTLGVDEYIHELKPLSENDAIQLLLRRIRMRWADRRFAQTEELLFPDLVRALDNLPLALELAAPLLADHSVGELMGILQRRFEVLRTNQTLPGMPVQHQSLEAALAVAWDMLSEEQRAVLSQCTIFTGPFDGKAVSSVIAVANRDPRRVLSSLVDRSLVGRALSSNDQIEYRLLESIRAYALLRSGPLDEDVHNRHSGYYIQYAADLCHTLNLGKSAMSRAAALTALRTIRSELTAIRHRSRESAPAVAALALLFEHELLRRDGPMSVWQDLGKEALQYLTHHGPTLPSEAVCQLAIASLDAIIDYDSAVNMVGLLLLTGALESQRGQLLAARWHPHLPRTDDASSLDAIKTHLSNTLGKVGANHEAAWTTVKSADVLVAAENMWSHPNAAAPTLLEFAEKVDPVGAIHLARSLAWATAESTPLGIDQTSHTKVAAELLRQLALGLSARQSEFTCPFGLLVSEMAFYQLCCSGLVDESEQTEAISLLTSVAAAARERGDRRVEGIARLQRLRFAEWIERSGHAPVNDRTSEWNAIDRLLRGTRDHYNIVYDRGCWFVSDEQWEQAKKEFAILSDSEATPPLERVRALSDFALIELYLDRTHQAESLLRTAMALVRKSGKDRVLGVGRDALGGFFGRLAIVSALGRKFSRAEEQLDQMRRCIGEDGIAPIYRVCVRGLRAKSGAREVNFGTFGDHTIIAPSGQGVRVAIELLEVMAMAGPQLRIIDRLAVRTALKLLKRK